MLRRVIPENIEFSTLLNKDLGSVKVDRGQIEQVIMNLVVNARDAMSSGGKVIIETANVDLGESYTRNHMSVEPGHYVMLSVSDTGIGMTSDIKKRIFEPFFTTKERGKGTGLGLSTVYGIIKQSNGHIWVYSQPGQGTTFKIYLPRTHEKSVESVKATALPKSTRGSETILVVEDQTILRKLACTLLRRKGYKLLEAPDAKQALRMMENLDGTPIHLLLTDLVMPGMSGRELADRVESLRPGIKVLFMSGYTDDVIARHGSLQEETKLISKPFGGETLAVKVREVLDRN